MRILLCSNWFAPSIGGVETTSKILAEEFTHSGSEVRVVTNTPGEPTDAPYEIVRQPSQKHMRELAAWCDVAFQNLISLRTLVGLLPSRKPVVVTHQSWMRRPDGSRGLENYLKLLAVRAVHNVSISQAIADSIPVKSMVIGNPFEAAEFEHLRSEPREKDIVFMGRLVSDKGCDLLLRAVAELKAEDLRPSVTVIGDGPEKQRLVDLADELGIRDQVTFVGALREGRGEVVAQHRIMVIPSLWAEPFGVVALEGIAAGCAIVASQEGGLPEAGGPCGLYFANRDAKQLAGKLRELLTNPQEQAKLVANGPMHLQRFRPQAVAREYLALFRSLLA